MEEYKIIELIGPGTASVTHLAEGPEDESGTVECAIKEVHLWKLPSDQASRAIREVKHVY